MTQKHTREVFTLRLIPNEGYVDYAYGIRYEVNFDALFQDKQKFYKHCAVRGNWMTDLYFPTQIQNTVGFLEITGLLSGYLHGDPSYPLLVMSPRPTPLFTVDNPNGYIYETGEGVLNSLENEHGLQTTSIPSGVRRFTVLETSVADNSIVAYGSLFELILQFELYN